MVGFPSAKAGARMGNVPQVTLAPQMKYTKHKSHALPGVLPTITVVLQPWRCTVTVHNPPSLALPTVAPTSRVAYYRSFLFVSYLH